MPGLGYRVYTEVAERVLHLRLQGLASLGSRCVFSVVYLNGVWDYTDVGWSR